MYPAMYIIHYGIQRDTEEKQTEHTVGIWAQTRTTRQSLRHSYSLC